MKKTPDRESNLLDGAAPFYRCYETKDGRYMSVGPIEPQFFAEFVRLAGLPEEHIKTQYDRSTWAQRRAEYQDLFYQKNRDEWVEIFDGTDACIAPVLNWNNAVKHPHNVARETYVEVDGVVQGRCGAASEPNPGRSAERLSPSRGGFQSRAGKLWILRGRGEDHDRKRSLVIRVFANRIPNRPL